MQRVTWPGKAGCEDLASITDLRAWASLAQAVDTGVTGGVSRWLARDCREEYYLL